MEGLRLLAGCLVMMAWGCSTNSNSSSGTRFSCDVTVGTVHTCVIYAYNSVLPAATLNTIKTGACSTGTLGTDCPSANTVGTCAVSTTNGGYTVGETTSYYTGTTSDGQQACAAAEGTWTTGSGGGGGGNGGGGGGSGGGGGGSGGGGGGSGGGGGGGTVICDGVQASGIDIYTYEFHNALTSCNPLNQSTFFDGIIGIWDLGAESSSASPSHFLMPASCADAGRARQ